jgi:hypothetical protein
MATISPYFDEALAPFGEPVVVSKGGFHRLWDAIVASRTASAERKMARYSHLFAEANKVSVKTVVDRHSLPF